MITLGQTGQSLVEVMICLGLSTLIMAALAITMNGQEVEGRRLRQRLAVVDLERTLTANLQDGSLCDFLVTTKAPPTFDPLALESDGSQVLMELDGVPSRAAADADWTVVADGKTPVSPVTPSVTARQIRIDDWTCDPRPCTPLSTDYVANLTITFNSERTVESLRPLKFPIRLKSRGTAHAQSLTGCTDQVTIATQAFEAEVQSCGGPFPNCPSPSPSVVQCPAGYQVSGCGYALSWWAPQASGTGAFDMHSNAPNDMHVAQNGCEVNAGEAPGCGVCFKAQAFCIKLR